MVNEVLDKQTFTLQVFTVHYCSQSLLLAN